MKCSKHKCSMADDGTAIYCPMCASESGLQKSAFDKQEGGGHYKDMAIQPAEFIERNELSFLEGCVVKRICRHRRKNGREDLEKIKHEVDMLIELHYNPEVLPKVLVNKYDFRCSKHWGEQFDEDCETCQILWRARNV